MSQVPPSSLSIWSCWRPFLSSLKLWRRARSHLTAQVTQTNEESPSESSLDLTLTQHPRDEKLEPREECIRLKVEPPRAWYYRISPNSRTLVILLQVNPASGDEPKIVCEGCYETEDTSIFAWSSVPGVGYYRWLRGPIRRLPSSYHSTHSELLTIMNYSIAEDLTCTYSSLLSLLII
jgi:hypothetical protein